jgi:hypothetical protein
MLTSNCEGRFTELQIFDCLSMKVGKTNREIRKEMNVSPGAEMALGTYLNLFLNHGFIRKRTRSTTLEERRKSNGYKFTEYLLTETGVQKRNALKQKPQRRVPCG